MVSKIYEITPYQNVGELSFADSRDIIRKKIGGSFDVGKYVVGDIVELYDYFTEEDMKILYDTNEQVRAIEFYNGRVVFIDKDLFTQNYNAIESYFLGLDSELEIFDMGFTSHKYGIGVGYNEINEPPDSIIVFVKGYYSGGYS